MSFDLGLSGAVALLLLGLFLAALLRPDRF
jgi:K+-transporting ATPase KdpF subunit